MKMRFAAAAILLLSASATHAAVTTFPMVPWDVESTEVLVTVDGAPVPVAETRNGPKVRYCHFDSDKPVTVVVTHPGKQGNGELLVASNDRTNVKPQRLADAPKSWQFTMRPGTKVYVKTSQTFICMSAPENKPPARAMQTSSILPPSASSPIPRPLPQAAFNWLLIPRPKRQPGKLCMSRQVSIRPARCICATG